MTGRTSRRFHLLDAMALVLATAVGLSRIRSLIEFAIRDCAVAAKSAHFSLMRDLGDWFVPAAPILAMWTLVLVPLGLRSPRPCLRRLARQPGWIACCAASLALVITGAWGFAQIYREEFYEGEDLDVDYAFTTIFILLKLCLAPMGCAVAGAWLTLLLTGKWRPEPTWNDRIGRVLGGLWIAAIPINSMLV